MNATKFRIPNTEIYLRSDGLFTPSIESGDAVVELTRDVAEQAKVAYLGQSLRNVAASTGGATDHSAEGMELAKGVLEWFTLGIEYLEFVEKLNHWVTGAHEAPDPIMENLQRIHSSLASIQDFALAAWVSARQDSLAFLRAHSSTAIQTAHAFTATGASRDDPVWAAKIAIAERDSLLAVNSFSDVANGYWLRPQSVAAVSWRGDPTAYYQGWMSRIPDRAEVGQFNQVWDYRWAQPALMYAIIARLIVRKAFGAQSKAEHDLDCSEVNRYADILGAVFSKRWGGLRALSALSDLQRSRYLTVGHIPMVAVDLYGGDYLGGVYFMSGIKPSGFPPGIAAPNMSSYLNPNRPLDLAWVEYNMKVFADHWWNILYLRTGLEELFLFISELRAVCEKTWFSRFYVDLHTRAR
ncbi:hypothetical protein V2H43_10750, partial [Pasteurella multocida]|uniref:hypothetical protein n=1 Tax=Pasteurella multocida TaxID=747 RepID=UPI002E9FE8EA|nr:hypothetical protein [Pasteurella multocida]